MPDTNHTEEFSSKSTVEADEASTRGVSRRTLLAAGGGLAVAGGVGVLFGPGLSGLLGDGETGWTHVRATPARTGVVSGDAGPGKSLSVAWKIEFQPFLARLEEVSVGFEEGDTHFGTVRDISSPTIVGDLVVLWLHYDLRPHSGGEQRQELGVFAFETATGDLAWSHTFEDKLYPWELAPVVVDGVIYQGIPKFGDSGMEMTVFDPADGEVMRQFDFDGHSWSFPLVDGDGVYTAGTTQDGERIFRLALDNGAREWSFDLDTDSRVATDSFYPLTKADDAVFVTTIGSEGTGIVSVDAGDGSQRWQTDFETAPSPISQRPEVLTPPVVYDGRGYVAGGLREWNQHWGSYLIAFDPDDGNERWRFRPDGGDGPIVSMLLPEDAPDPADLTADGDADGTTAGYPLLVDDIVVVPGVGMPAVDGDEHEDGRYLYGVNDADGSLEWSVPGALSYAPVAAGDVVYVIGANDEVLAVTVDGTVADSITVDEINPIRYLSPAIANGKLFVPGTRGIVALE